MTFLGKVLSTTSDYCTGMRRLVIVITVVISKSHLALTLTAQWHLLAAPLNISLRRHSHFMVPVQLEQKTHLKEQSKAVSCWSDFEPLPSPRICVDKTVQNYFTRAIHTAKEYLHEPTGNPTNTSPSPAPNRTNRITSKPNIPSGISEAVAQQSCRVLWWSPWLQLICGRSMGSFKQVYLVSLQILYQTP